MKPDKLQLMLLQKATKQVILIRLTLNDYKDDCKALLDKIGKKDARN